MSRGRQRAQTNEGSRDGKIRLQYALSKSSRRNELFTEANTYWYFGLYVAIPSLGRAKHMLVLSNYGFQDPSMEWAWAFQAPFRCLDSSGCSRR